MENNWIILSYDIPTEYGKYPGSRSVDELIKNGIIILDKWPGPTSHDVVATIKKIFGLKRAGHSGTLDPYVSGVLPITLENSCKVIPALQNLDKEYVGIMHLHKDVDENELNETIKKFIGEIKQIPPVRSAVTRKLRTRKIYSFDILERKDRDVLFKINCQAGTYIRKLIDDIGRSIGGAHMRELRRIKVGRFDESKIVKIHDIVDAYYLWKECGDELIRDFILPIEAAIEHLGKIIIKDSAIPSIINGSPLYTGGICKIQRSIKFGELIAILTLKGELVALAKSNINAEDIRKRKCLVAKTDRVIMKKEVYSSFKLL
ncbi:MAG: RNA-guided pseudouridylation complex pseudouridine synthase subunit Cbf5 [Candidatus Aenigmatarchaeota archaeon]